MESDSVRTIGDSTLVDMWIDGKVRAVSVSRDAIGTFLQLPPDRAAAMSDDERGEFVRKNLTLVAKAATELLRSTPSADSIAIEAGQLTGRSGVRMGDQSSERRHGDRRRGDRRKGNLGPPPSGERRR